MVCIVCSQGCKLGSTLHYLLYVRGGVSRVQIAPKEEQELQQLRGYKGPRDALKPPEQLLHMLANVPRASEKMRLVIARANFKVCGCLLLSNRLVGSLSASAHVGRDVASHGYI